MPKRTAKEKKVPLKHARLHSVLPMIVLFGIFVIFFWRVFVQGKIPVPADLLLNAYFPWHDYAWPPYTAGVVPVKNPEIADGISQFFPFAQFIYEQVRSLTLPLWNPYIGSGMPFLAAYHTSVLVPFTVLAFITSLPWYWTLQTILPLLFLGLFSYLFFKTLTTSRFASLVGAIALMINGYTMFWLELGPGVKTVMWIPLILFTAHKLYTNIRWYWFCSFVVAIAFCAVSGEVPAFLSAILLLVIFCFIDFLDRRRVWLYIPILIGLLCGLLLASPQLLLTFEYQSLSTRASAGYDYLSTLGFGITPFSKLITFLVPDYFGNPATNNYWGKFFYYSGHNYIGLLPLFFILFALYKKERRIVVLGTSLVILLCFFYDTPLAHVVYSLHVPIFSLVSANRMAFLLLFLLTTLSVIGIDSILNATKNTIKSIKLFVIPIIFLVVSISTILFFKLNINPTAKLGISLHNMILPFLFMAFYIPLLFLLIKNPKNILYKLSILFIFSFELLRFGWKNTPFVPKNFLFPEVALTNFLQQDKSFYRVGGTVPSNFFMPYHIASIEGYDSLTVGRYSNYIGSANQASAPGLFLEFTNPLSPLLNIANTKYIVETKFDDKGEPAEDGQPSIPLRNDQYKKVFDDKRVGVYENLHVLPRVQIYHKYQVMNSKDIFTTLREGTVDNTLLLEKKPNLQIAEDGQTNEATITTYTTQAVTIKTKTDSNSLLLLTDTYYPGWEATVDGKKTEIIPAYGTFRAVALPMGDHVIQFVYKSYLLQLGKWLAVIGVAGTILSALYLRLKNIRNV